LAGLGDVDLRNGGKSSGDYVHMMVTESLQSV
jgi:hypothetical protein